MLDNLIKEPFTGFYKESLEFLKKLENKKYNNKIWFDENRDSYERFIKIPMRTLIDNLSGEFYKLDSKIVVNYKSIFRINRDIRFSKDKTPYKSITSASFCFNTIKKPEIPQFYFHISPIEFLIAGGQYSTDGDKLKKIRRRIYKDYENFKKITSEKSFVKEYKQISGERLKSLPREYNFLKFEKSEKMLEDILKMKQFYIWKTYKSDLALDADLINVIMKNFYLMYEFTKFLDEAIKT